MEATRAEGIPGELGVVDRPSRATEVAEQHGVAAVHGERTTFGEGFDRTGYTKQVMEVLEEHAIDLIVMAGFGTVFAEPIHDAFPHRILNTHPALLHAFKGWHAVPAALEYGVRSEEHTTELKSLMRISYADFCLTKQ